MFLHRFDKLREFDGTIVVADGAGVRVLNAAFDHAAAQRGALSWRPPTVMTWGNVLQQRFERDALDGAFEDVEFVLTRDQELCLWQAVIAADRQLDMSAPEQAAPLARDAWLLQHAWALPPSEAGQAASLDVSAFRRWAAAYRERTGALRVTDTARLLHHYAQASARTQSICAQGFIEPPRLLERWFAAAGAPTAEGPRGDAAAYRGHVFRDREQELHAALQWAGECAAADAGMRVAVVLDTLGQEAALVRRCVHEVFGSEYAAGEAAVFLNPGESLLVQPLIQLALLVLDIDELVRWDRLSELIRHPLLGGAAAERAERAVFDAELRALERYELPLLLVLRQLAAGATCARLAGLLQALLDRCRDLPRRQSLVAWLEHFDACLAAVEWPGEGQAGATRTRLLAAWGEACDRLNRLAAVVPAATRGEALAWLQRFLRDAVLRPPASACGVFVVTPAEALVIEPHALWLAGCESDVAFAPARPSPLLPLDQQRSAGVPGSEPARDLGRARAMIESLAAHGRQLHASFASGDGELRFLPSPLLPGLATVPPEPASEHFVPDSWRQAAAALSGIDDRNGPALTTAEAVRGGIGIIAAQAACAFRAFARHRLAAREVEEPRPGISARAKGELVHRALAALWGHYADRDRLRAAPADERRGEIDRALDTVLIAPPLSSALERELLGIERARLRVLLERWLNFESEREAFTVLAREQTVTAELGGLPLTTRLDRVDRQADGTIVIVDYKTGRVVESNWQPPRMNEPQLPYYALCAPYADTAAIAFAQVDSARPRWLQRPREGDEADWATLRDAWRDDIEQLVAAFRAGAAMLDPKYGNTTCQHCEQALLCRRIELALIDTDEREEDADVE